MKRLAIVVGNNVDAQGAVRTDTGQSEYIWNGQLAAMIQDAARNYDMAVDVFRRTPGGGYRQEIRRVYAQTDAWGAAATIELHFNGAESASATGTETLTSGTPASMRLAVEVQNEMVAALGLRDRGIHTRRTGRGSGSLMSGQAPAILIEPFFGSSPKGQSATDTQAEMRALAGAIVRGAARALDAMPRQSLDESRTIQTADQAEKNTKRACGGILALVGVETVPEAFAALSEAQGKLEGLLPVLTQNWPVLLIGAVAALAYYRGPQFAEAIRTFRREDNQKELR